MKSSMKECYLFQSNIHATDSCDGLMIVLLGCQCDMPLSGLYYILPVYAYLSPGCLYISKLEFLSNTFCIFMHPFEKWSYCNGPYGDRTWVADSRVQSLNH